MQHNTANTLQATQAISATHAMQPKQCGKHFKPWDNYRPNVGMHNWFIKSLARPYTSTITYKAAKEEHELYALIKESGLKKMWLDNDEEQIV